MLGLKEMILGKQTVLLGELQGTKEIPELLTQFFIDLHKEMEFTVCLELPDNDDIESTLREHIPEGKGSMQYLQLIRKLREDGIKVVFVDAEETTHREEIIAERILAERGLVFALLGDVHAAKVILFGKLKPAGSILARKLGSRLVSIHVRPEAGEFYSFGIKKVPDYSTVPADAFDHIFRIQRVSPCTRLRMRNN
jgi:hypothetical protein